MTGGKLGSTSHHIGAQFQRLRNERISSDVVEIQDGGAKLDPANGRCLCGSCHTRTTIAARARRLVQ
jgi:5-methylcytosine-specific restriction protein A